jgi:hypothetical protein
MPFPAEQVLRRVGFVLSDEAGVRWTFPERLAWLRDGLVAAGEINPRLLSDPIIHTTTAGAAQDLTDPAHVMVLDFLCHQVPVTGGGWAPGPSIRPVPMKEMEAEHPRWRMDPVTSNGPYAEVAMQDPILPTRFYLWPPQPAGRRVELVVCNVPDDIAPPANPTVLASYAAVTIPGDRNLVPILVDYVCSRCLSKEAEFASSAARAGAHYQAFLVALGAGAAAKVMSSASARRVTPEAQSGAGAVGGRG